MHHIMLLHVCLCILHVHEVTFLSGGGGECGGLMAGWDKPETTVQEYVLTFINEQELDIFSRHRDISQPCLWQYNQVSQPMTLL